jgi:hypothetical protein
MKIDILRRQGNSVLDIAVDTGMAPNTVRKYPGVGSIATQGTSASRGQIPFVALKTAAHAGLVKSRTALANQIRGLLEEHC